MKFGAASRLQNFISSKRYKISARANPAHKAPVCSGALTPTKSARAEVYSHGVRSHGIGPRHDPPASKSQSMRAAKF
ncbi:hypothetical protein CAMGR0001_0733 [Campylobacter gracilis RM3268]|uniref:Uncharacterized protein n=1 Tax=Campylobacter gracilis RM3268 TaxID=553220 RepID=C8PFU1_9BACT|nr:hypothetical protein CAMGR0001_0733 [Campylobacter gracilis RM3268]